VKLAVADIDGIDDPCAALEENLAEAAGGSADIEADLAPGIDGEALERRRKLQSAARHIGMGGRGPKCCTG
jgi:hypothetical protein